jgi:hypothetical protein
MTKRSACFKPPASCDQVNDEVLLAMMVSCFTADSTWLYSCAFSSAFSGAFSCTQSAPHNASSIRS